MDYNILRENDIRGEYPTQINGKVGKRVAEAFAVYLNDLGVKKCMLGHDNRISSEEIYKEILKALLSSGIDVVSIGLVTTPLFNYASIINKVPYGIMITASHNKASDNGLKIFGENYLHLKQDELKKLYKLIKEEASITGTGNLEEKQEIDSYVNMLTDKFKTINKKVVVDCGNGTASTIIKQIFSKIFIDVSYLNCESDGTFPVHNPDPNVEENLNLLKKMVLLKGADLGIAVDGDADRVGIIDNKGNMIATDYLIGIFAREIVPKNENKDIIIDVKCSVSLAHEIKKIGGNPIMVKNGSAYIERIVHDHPALLGGEFSGHIFFRDDYYGFDDGIYAGLRVAKLIDEENKASSDLTKGMEVYENTPEIRLNVDDNIKFNLVNYIKEYAQEKNYKINTCDGVRVDYDDGFSLVRCSNTGPCITLRFEASTKEKLEARKEEFMSLIDNYLKEKI